VLKAHEDRVFGKLRQPKGDSRSVMSTLIAGRRYVLPCPTDRRSNWPWSEPACRAGAAELFAQTTSRMRIVSECGDAI